MTTPNTAPIEFRVVIEPSLEVIVPDAISFETGASLAEATDPNLFVYEHHGAGFDARSPGALPRFFEDLVMGRALPLTFATPRLRDVDVLFALTLFLHRDLAIHPSTPGVIASVDMAHRLGEPFLGHLDRGLDRLIRRLRTFFPAGLSKGEAASRLSTSLGWVRDYINEGVLPHPGREPAPPRILDVGTNGFVLAQTEEPRALGDTWIELYRRGYLRGVLVSADREGRRRVLASRKSDHVAFDLQKAAFLLNELEKAMGEEPEWVSEGCWLMGPEGGTLILTTHMMEVFLRV